MLTFGVTWVHPSFFVGSVLLIFLVFCVVLLCVFMFWVPCCDVRCDFRKKPQKKRCSVRLYTQSFVGELMLYFHSFPVVSWFGLFIYLWVFTFPFEDCSEFGNFVNYPYLGYLHLVAYSGVYLILCDVFALFFFVFCILYCQFFCIVHLWLPLRYSLALNLGHFK